jgi:tetratricopeptide (TPR) repeat protein
MTNRKIIEKLKSKNYINSLLEDINKTTSPIANCQNYYCLGLAYSQIAEHQKALNALCEAYIIYNEAELSENNQLYGEIILVSICELIYFEKYSESLNFIDELLLISPDLPDALFYRGICQQALGDISAAIETFKYTLELLNNNLNNIKDLNPLEIMSRADTLIPDLMLKLSSCYLQTGNKQSAYDYLKKLEYLNIWTANELKFIQGKIAEISE